MTAARRPVYTGRHRLADTQVIALPAVAPLRLSRPLRPVPLSSSPTAALPPVRLLPPVAPDYADRLRLTRRGRQVRAVLIAVLAVSECLVVALATRGQVLTWDGWLSVSH